MKTTATRGDTRGSNWAERHHRGTAEALEGRPEPGRGWSRGVDSRGSPASSTSGTMVRGLPGRATAFYEIVECV